MYKEKRENHRSITVAVTITKPKEAKMQKGQVPGAK